MLLQLQYQLLVAESVQMDHMEMLDQSEQQEVLDQQVQPDALEAAAALELQANQAPLEMMVIQELTAKLDQEDPLVHQEPVVAKVPPVLKDQPEAKDQQEDPVLLELVLPEPPNKALLDQLDLLDPLDQPDLPARMAMQEQPVLQVRMPNIALAQSVQAVFSPLLNCWTMVTMR